MMPHANRQIGSISSHDISVPLGALPEFIIRAGGKIGALGDFRINCFGHVGDGNLHYNVFPVQGRSREDHLEDRLPIKTAIHELVHELGGSVSAEHGIGKIKRALLSDMVGPEVLSSFVRLKRHLDPAWVLGRGTMIDSPR